MSKKLVYGVGLYEKGEFAAKVGGKMVKEYELWAKMLQRCYSGNYQDKYPTYKGCSVSQDFTHYQKFAEWCQSQVGFGIKGFALDKDVIYKGNKQYNADSCAFIPTEVNNLLTQSNSSRGVCPIGVCFDKQAGKFGSSIRVAGKCRRLGRFSSPEEAFSAYKTAKETYVKVVAEKYKDSIDPRVYQALLEWEVDVED